MIMASRSELQHTSPAQRPFLSPDDDAGAGLTAQGGDALGRAVVALEDGALVALAAVLGAAAAAAAAAAAVLARIRLHLLPVIRPIVVGVVLIVRPRVCRRPQGTSKVG